MLEPVVARFEYLDGLAEVPHAISAKDDSA
jgi:hypothetical protein